MVELSQRLFVAENQSCDGLTVQSLIIVQDVYTEMRHHFGIDNLARLLKFFNDLIGVDALQAFEGASVPSEVRLRVVGRTETLDAAQRIGREVESLLTNGPCGGGGASRVARATVAIESTLVPRAWVPTSLVWEQV